MTRSMLVGRRVCYLLIFSLFHEDCYGIESGETMGNQQFKGGICKFGQLLTNLVVARYNVFQEIPNRGVVEGLSTGFAHEQRTTWTGLGGGLRPKVSTFFNPLKVWATWRIIPLSLISNWLVILVCSPQSGLSHVG